MGFHIQGRIESVLNDLPNSERRIGEYILAYPDKVITMTASQLAQAAGSSSATVIRFCRSIDVPGFTELKVLLATEIEKPRTEGYSDIQENETLDSLKEKLLGNAYQSMLETIEQLNNEMVEKMVESIANSSTLFVYGVGASGLAAENIQQKWSRVGKNVIFMSDVHSFLSALVSADQQDMFWGISNSGETSEIKFLMKKANELGLKTASLTQFGHNTLSNLSQIPLYTVKTNEAMLRSAATSSLHAQFVVIDVLFFMYASKNYKQNYEAIKKSREAIQEFNQFSRK